MSKLCLYHVVTVVGLFSLQNKNLVALPSHMVSSLLHNLFHTMDCSCVEKFVISFV